MMYNIIVFPDVLVERGCSVLVYCRADSHVNKHVCVYIYMCIYV